MKEFEEKQKKKEAKKNEKEKEKGKGEGKGDKKDDEKAKQGDDSEAERKVCKFPKVRETRYVVRCQCALPQKALSTEKPTSAVKEDESPRIFALHK